MFKNKKSKQNQYKHIKPTNAFSFIFIYCSRKIRNIHKANLFSMNKDNKLRLIRFIVFCFLFDLKYYSYIKLSFCCSKKGKLNSQRNAWTESVVIFTKRDIGCFFSEWEEKRWHLLKLGNSFNNCANNMTHMLIYISFIGKQTHK